jgi:hypothetical protein
MGQHPVRISRGMASGFAGPAPPSLGVWYNVTPAGVNLSNPNLGGTPGNFGTQTIGHDPANPGTMYAAFDAQGIYKSTDYGQTWSGPVNTGTLAATITASGGAGITVGSGGVVYFSCIRGTPGFYKSTNGGVDWTNYNVGPLASNRQDCYPPQINPYNASHLLMSGHEQNFILQSFDGGQTWASVNMASTGGGSGNGMLEAAGTGFIFFVNTGNSSTTANTWLWLAQWSSGSYGTWLTTNGGTSWTQVDTNEHPHGTAQIYQPNTTGDVFIAGLASAHGNGVLHSSDYGATWALAGASQNETVVAGTSKNLYAMYGWAIGLSNNVSAQYETAAVPAAGSAGVWTNGSVPAGIYQAAGQIDVVNDGLHNILVGAMWGAGIWRYIEP